MRESIVPCFGYPVGYRSGRRKAGRSWVTYPASARAVLTALVSPSIAAWINDLSRSEGFEVQEAKANDPPSNSIKTIFAGFLTSTTPLFLCDGTFADCALILLGSKKQNALPGMLRPRRRLNFPIRHQLCLGWAMDYAYPGSSISFTPKGGLSIPHWGRGVKRQGYHFHNPRLASLASRWSFRNRSSR